MAGNLRQEMKGMGIVETPENLLQYWLDTLKANMHTILCFSPVGDAFRTRARKFPGLITCAMIDYFHAWPPQALNSVAMKFLSEIQLQNDQQREDIATYMASVHLSIKECAKRFYEIEKRIKKKSKKNVGICQKSS